MKRRRVLLDPVARDDLRQIRRWIALRGAPRTGTAYVTRVIEFAMSLDIAAERGQPLPEIGNGLRMIPFESVMLAVNVESDRVVILRVFHASQDWLKQLRRNAAAAKRPKPP